MVQESVLLFADVRIDLASECVWRGEQALKFTPTAFALLHYLAAHPGRLITKNELLEALWPETAVTEGVLTTHVRQIRQALGDDAKTPRFIETVHRRGYRFIAPPITSPQPVPSPRSQVQSPYSAIRIPQSAISLVGREAELRQLHKWLEQALGGERQIIFVSGEPGIGKTAVVEAFLAQVATEGQVWIGRGQCIEHYGAGEAYLPVLEALGRLCRGPEGARFTELLNHHAPTWLVQMPALLDRAELEALQRKTQGTTRERMLRELAEALEALTAERPLVLRFEDLHWSDVSTLDWLAFLARRQEPARLLVLGTYRPVEMLANGHPLRTVKQELQQHRQCAEAPLGLLSEEAVAEYLTQRLPVRAQPAAPLHQLARVIHQRTEGNPLFMVTVVEYLVAQGNAGGSVEALPVGIPRDLRQMIEEQLHRLSPEAQRVLEAASAAGAEFSAMAVAAGLEMAVGEVEEQCEELARREQFLRAQGTAEWPDGTVAARYSFLHALYQEVLYDRVPAGRRARLHRQIGEREEAAYGERAREIAAALAVHFERGRDYRRAVRYLQHAGENAIRRSANQEAISLLTKGLELLSTLPDTPERTQQELTLQTTLGPVLIATKGYAAPEVGRVYARARELCQQVGETPQLFTVMQGLQLFYLVRAEYKTARELGEQLLTLAQRQHDPVLLVWAHLALVQTLFYLGELASARVHVEQGMAFYDLQQYRSLAWAGSHPGVVYLLCGARVLCHLGYPDQALKRGQEALALARELSHPFSLCYALNHTAMVHQLRREGQAAQERAEAAIALSSEQGFLVWSAQGTILQGWALAEQGQKEEGIVQMRQGLAAWRPTGAEIARPFYLALLAEVYGKVGQTEEGLSLLAEALAAVHKTGERYYEVELYRLKGELILQSKVPSPKSQVEKEAEECFLQAIEIARQQSAKSLELRAVISLSRLWQQQGKKKQARRMLAEIYGWFTEGFDTKDLQETKTLLEELSS